jgi:hypothetical protein
MLDEPAKVLIMFVSKSVIQMMKENYALVLSRYRSTEHGKCQKHGTMCQYLDRNLIFEAHDRSLQTKQPHMLRVRCTGL